jgi:hypothetical protein
MLRKFNFDYDLENNSLFMYDPKSKTKASVEIEDMVIDYNSKMQISGVELLNATQFFKDLSFEKTKITKKLLKEIIDCKVEIISKSNYYILKLVLSFESNKQIAAPLLIPTVTGSSLALSS